ncbi:MAG: AEC family transporter [Methanobacteriota archaeon]
MNEIVGKIIPVILVFFVGCLLRKVKLAGRGEGDFLLRLVFHVCLPALVLTSVSRVDLAWDLVYLPLIACAIILTTYVAAYSIGKQFNLERPTLGVFMVGSLIMNTGFALPFIIAAYGSEGVAKLSIFDFGNGFLTFTFIYYLAVKYGSVEEKVKIPWKKILVNPPLWALTTALILNLMGVVIDGILSSFLETLGDLTIPLVMIALGLYFTPKLVKFKALSTALFLRMGLGFILGLAAVKLLSLEGISKAIVLVSAASPIGYNTITFSSLEKLDTEFAASLVSIGILLGLLYIPMLLIVIG